MFLPRTSCIICGEHIAKIKYNLKTTYSEKCNILLIKLVENYYKNIVFLHCNICSNCYNLLNELDAVKQREKELYKQLKSHISKLENSKDNIANMKNEDMTGNDSSHTVLPKDGAEKNNISNTTEDELSSLNIADIDLKKLPIKVKRIPIKNNHCSSKAVPLSKPVTPKKSYVKDNDKVFEQIQTSIQMDLSKHVEEHMNKCKPAKNVLCEICGQNFKTKSGYENHMKKHDDVDDELKLLALNKVDENWFCNVCGKNFNQKGALARHLAIHTGERRYQCEECGKKFLHHSSFNMHRKIHAGQRNFKCQTCNHGFLTNSHLKRHIRSTHDKEKKNVCDICNKRFGETYGLTAHMKTVHKDGINIVQLQEEDKTALYYQVEEGSLVKGDTMIRIDDGPTTDLPVVFLVFPGLFL